MATTKPGPARPLRKRTRARVAASVIAPTGRLYGGRSATERRAERRARLMKVGLEMFGTAGFQSTTIPLLCSAAGVTARHFYDEFPSREALLRALYDEITDAMHQLVIGELRRPGTTMRERIRNSNAVYFRYLTNDARLARIYVLEAVGISGELEHHRRAKRESIVKSLTKAAARLEGYPVDDVPDYRLFSAGLAGAAHDLLLEWVLAPRRPSVEKMIDTITTIWVRTLQIDRLPENVS